ncbi:unnamed protein product [Leuciscus chuanchicus]
MAYRAKHQNGETPLIRAGIPCVGSFVLDYMHLVCLGVVRHILYYLCRIPNPRRLSPRQRAELSSELIKLRNSMPSEMARKPRSLQELDRWKATEFRQFLLYTGPVILHGIVDQDLYHHFLCLTIGMSILLSADHKNLQAFPKPPELLKNRTPATIVHTTSEELSMDQNDQLTQSQQLPDSSSEDDEIEIPDNPSPIRERSNSSSRSHHGSDRRHSTSTSRHEFQKCVLKKLVEIMQEVKRIGSAEPNNSSYHIRRMELIEELNTLEEKLQNNEEREMFW